SVYDFLKSEGASFTAELQGGLNLKSAALNVALGELVLAGLVTYDTLEPARAMLQADGGNEDEGESGPVSAFEAELAQRLRQVQRPDARPRLTGTRLREAKRRVSNRLRNEARLQGEAGFNPLPPPVRTSASMPAGRWSLVHRVSVLGPAASDEARAERLAR